MTSNNAPTFDTASDAFSEVKPPFPTAGSSSLSSTPEPHQEEDFVSEDPTVHVDTSIFVSSSTPSKFKPPSVPKVATLDKSGKLQRANKETHKLIDQALIGELADAMIELEGIIESSLSDEAIGFDPAELLQHLSRKGNRKYKNNLWTTFEDTKVYPSEPRTMGYFDRLSGIAERFIAKKTGAKRLRYYSDAFYNTPVKDDDCDRKPDGVLTGMRITKKDKKDKNLPTCVAIDGILEMKPELRYASEGHEQLSGCARLIFKNQPNRRKVFGVLLVGDEMTFCVFDRSGKVTSPSFNIHEKPELFLRVVVGLCYIDRETLGVDQTINLEGPKENWTVEVKGKKYPIQKVVYTEGVIRGRGTACYEVRLKNGSSALVKDSWVDISRDEREVDILKSLADIDHCQHIPEVVEDEVVEFGGKEDTTARIREPLLKKAIKDGKTTWEWIDEKYKNNELRRHERILLTPFGIRIEQFRSLEELLNAIKHIALVIWDLQTRNCLHRDVSTRNVLLRFFEGRLQGLLIDYHYAIKSTRAWSSAIGHRTGTVPFMAIDVLVPADNMVHAYHHDLESLFYVLCWICSIQGGPANLQRAFDYKESEIRRWNAFDDSKTSMKSVKDSKLAIMPNKKLFEERITKNFAEYFKPVVPCIEKLRKMLFSALHADDDDIPGIQQKLEAALNANPRDDGVIQTLVYQLPVRVRDPVTVCRSFVDIIEEGIGNLPGEHRWIPWIAPTRVAEKYATPKIEMSRPLDVVGVVDKRKDGSSTDNDEGQTKAPPHVRTRSLRSGSMAVGALGQSKGTKRTLATDAPELQRIPSLRPSKRLKSASEQRSKSNPHQRLRPSQAPSYTSSSNSSLPMTPPNQPSSSSPRVVVGDLASDDELTTETSKQLFPVK